MCVKYLVLLVWFPGVLHAQNCPAPRLNGGYFFPVKSYYNVDEKLNYACEKGRKPAAEGWWAKSTCQNGKWSPQPQCIDETACISPNIPNGKHTESQSGWYAEREVIRITCNDGYEHKDNDATARCVNGSWSSVPVCERDIRACAEPPKIPHAVIIHHSYRELFAEDSEVQYECEDGYTVDGANNKKSIFCIAGSWTEAPTCSRGTGAGAGHAGSAGGGHTTSTGSGTQPVGGGHTTSTGSGTQPVGGGHTTSTGSGTQPVGGGSSSSSSSNVRETAPQITRVSSCRNPPTLPNGDIVETTSMYLRYQCSSFYKQIGPEKVYCYSDGTWSIVPHCREAFCSVNTGYYPALKPVGVKFIKDGESVRLECVKLDHWWVDHYSVGRCTDGRLRLSQCCNWFELNSNTC